MESFKSLAVCGQTKNFPRCLLAKIGAIVFFSSKTIINSFLHNRAALGVHLICNTLTVACSQLPFSILIIFVPNTLFWEGGTIWSTVFFVQ